MGVVQLKTNLRLFEALTIIIGSMIGSGILRLPGNMISELHSPSLVILAWVVGALLTVMGALTFAEMASMYPRAGGQYHFLKEGVGPFWSYLFGWSMFWVIMSGIVASVSLAFADFLGGLLSPSTPILGWLAQGPDPATGAARGLIGDATPLVLGDWTTGITLPAYGNAFVAVFLILALAGLNYLSTRYSGHVSNYTTVGKYVGLVALVAIILVGGTQHPDAFQPFVPTDQSGGGLLLAFGAAMALTLFAFDGWPQATYVASEIRNPKRNLPTALVGGPIITAIIYILLTVAYFWVIPLDEAIAIGQDPEGRIAVNAAAAVWTGGATFIGLVAIVSLFGTVNAYVLTSPRIFYAMARDGALLKGMARLSERRHTPAFALLIFALWSSILVMSGLYVQIVKMVVYGIWLFYVPTAIAHIRLRRNRPDIERPFRTPLFPFIPILFLLAAVFVVYVSWFDPAGGLSADWPYIAGATGLILLGIPFYFLQRRGHQELGSESADVDAPGGTPPGPIIAMGRK